MKHGLNTEDVSSFKGQVSSGETKRRSRIEYYVVNRAGRNRGIIAAFGFWPLNVIKHRGWGERVTWREMTEEEQEREKQRMRYYCLRYHSLASLLEDEKRALESDPSAFEFLSTRLSIHWAVRAFSAMPQLETRNFLR